MTSSLVGSEMCIRDRLEDRRCKTLPPLRTLPPCWRATSRATCSTLSSNCLLYTSDAADDM
eukprot:7655879-Prorocentrum_lima.AAC.1